MFCGVSSLVSVEIRRHVRIYVYPYRGPRLEGDDIRYQVREEGLAGFLDIDYGLR
ncbi:hypothetical protein ID866_3421 [Astraeus odoratus]|nr:hypothetical protein ID866_3421 [Astraeus odoratus]